MKDVISSTVPCAFANQSLKDEAMDTLKVRHVPKQLIMFFIGEPRAVGKSVSIFRRGCRKNALKILFGALRRVSLRQQENMSITHE